MKEKIPHRLRIHLLTLKNCLNKQLEIIEKILKETEEEEPKFKCPQCDSRDVRVNLNNIYCRKCGEKFERIGNTILK